MSINPFVIGGVEIPLGTSKQINLEVSKLPTRTEIYIPASVFRAKEEGPTLLLLAGMHGDEINGVEIIRKMIANSQLMPKKGSVIAISLFNIYGFLNFSRQVPDGKDVNRSFPGNPNGSLASRMVYKFMQEVFPVVDFGIDFHTGGASINNFPQVRCTFDLPMNLELAKAFSPQFIINSKLRDKSFRKEAHKYGKSIIVYEGGESQRLNAMPVNEGIKGTLRVMRHLGMIDTVQPKNETFVIASSSWVRAKFAGMFRATVINGVLVKKGEVLGSITDPYGEFEEKIKAPETGHIIAINNQPIVNQGDALIHLGFE